MVDLMYIFDEENGEDPNWDFFVSMALVASFVSMFMMLVFGLYPPVNTALLVAPLGFMFMLIGAIAFYPNLRYSYASSTVSASLWTIPQAIIVALGAGALGGSFNALGEVYIAPADPQGYLNTVSVISNLSPAMQAIFNNRLAPIVETFGLVAITYILARVALEADIHKSLPGGKLSLAVLVATPASIIFGWIHGDVNIVFFIKAFTVMFVTLVAIFGEELTEDDLLPIIVITALGASVHAGLNLYEFGGYSKYLQILLTAQTPELYISFIWIAFEATMWAVTAIGIGMKTYEVVFE